jgi:subtilisin family serine protease
VEVSHVVIRRLLVLASVLTLVLPGSVLAQNPSGADRFQREAVRAIDPLVLPFGVDDTRHVNVMLEMRGDPVTVVESQRPGKLSKAERDRIKADLKARQDAIRGQIEAHGGRVLAQLQLTYNGIKVRVSRQDVAALASLPNVTAIRAVEIVTRGNATSVPYLGIPSEVWDPESGLGYTGAGVKIAVIDTGIDYTHANFGGPGTVEAYELANANDTTINDPGDAGLFGEGAPKVMGGYDLVGDDYDAAADDGSPALIPHPDPDPLDCVYTDGSVGHGSHVSGTATGFGVNADGTTYEGPYDSTTPEHDFLIGPGVAPEAELYFFRVFGCDGSTDVTVEAIEMAVAAGANVINMSLGSPFGRADDPSAVAATNAAAAGVTVVTSAGNSGPSQYITGSPGSGAGSISTAAIDSTENYTGVSLALDTGKTVVALSANGVAPPDGTTYQVKVLQNIEGTGEDESLGCSVDAFTLNGIVESDDNVLAVTNRGTCARVARAVFGQQAGADAVAMINSSAGYPPYEGPIAGNPDTGEAYEVSIPFLGIQGPLNGTDAQNLRAATTATTTIVDLPNPGFELFASFSSNGPRNGDSALKPDIAAPGVSIMSTASGTGGQGQILSGTSMASPHVAGIAALVRQAHPGWTTEEVKAAIVNTGSPSGIGNYSVIRAGSGLVSPAAAISTSVVALGDVEPENADLGLAEFQTASLSFGYEELDANFSATHTITVRNLGDAAVTLTPSVAPGPGSKPATLSFGAGSVTVDPGASVELPVTLNVPAASVGNGGSFKQVSGSVVLSGDGVSLRVPYLLVPRAVSEVTATGKLTNSSTPSTFRATNTGPVAGAIDPYQLGLTDGDDLNEDALGGGGYDLRAAGVQSFAVGDDRFMVFALNTHDRWSNGSVNEFDVYVDTNRDGTPDFIVIGYDQGSLLTGSFNGVPAAFLYDLNAGTLSYLGFSGLASTDSSTYYLPVYASDLGMTSGAFAYTVVSYSLEGAGTDQMSGSALFDPWNPALTGGFAGPTVAPGASATFAMGFNPTAYAAQHPLGAMLVVEDNASGAGEAQLILGPGNRRGQ